MKYNVNLKPKNHNRQPVENNGTDRCETGSYSSNGGEVGFDWSSEQELPLEVLNENGINITILRFWTKQKAAF